MSRLMDSSEDSNWAANSVWGFLILVAFAMSSAPVLGQPNMPPEFTNCPSELFVDHCSIAEYDLEAEDIEDDDFWFELAENTGAGEAYIEAPTGMLYYSPSPEDVGNAVNVTVNVCDAIAGCGAPCTIIIIVTNNIPVIDCGRLYEEAVAGIIFEKNDIEGYDPDPCDLPAYYIVSGPGTINPATGTYHYEPTVDDIGTIKHVAVAVSDGFDIDECSFEINVLPEAGRGDANGDGNINLGDAVFLINHIFHNGPAPVPAEAGDANCDGGVNVGDAVYLVNYVFRDGPAPGCYYGACCDPWGELGTCIEVTEDSCLYADGFYQGDSVFCEFVECGESECRADLDIDSDNNNGINPPDRSGEEDDIETPPPGKYICLNRDDDDLNQFPDLYDEPIKGNPPEDDPVPMILDLGPNLIFGDWRLNYTNQVEVYDMDVNPHAKIEPGTIYPCALTPNPKTVMVEGVRVSTAPGDVTISLEYDCIGIGTFDFYDEVTATVIELDLDLDGTAEYDELDPGKIVLINDDFDENNEDISGNTVPDNQPHYNGSAYVHRIVDNDPELENGRIHLNGSGVTGRWKLTFPDKIKVWQNTTTEITSGVLSPEVTLPIIVEFKMEGISLSNNHKDIILNASFIPSDAGGAECCRDSALLTVGRVKLEPITLLPSNDTVFPLHNPSGIENGGSAEYEIEFEPASVPDSCFRWNISDGNISFAGDSLRKIVEIAGNGTGYARLQVAILGLGWSIYTPDIEMEVLDRTTVKAFVYIVAKDDSTGQATTTARVNTLMAGVNQIYEQVAMVFQIQSISIIDSTAWLDISKFNDYEEMDSLCATHWNTGGVEIYFVDNIEDANALNYSPDSKEAGCIISDGGNFRTVAHELGHACGLEDIYIADNSGSGTPLPDAPPKKDWEPDDWNNGPGPQYYASSLDQKDLIQRLLMYGIFSSKKGDIPYGCVYGYDVSDIAGLVDVGLRDMTRTPVHW
jgi:hypothetical protein